MPLNKVNGWEQLRRLKPRPSLRPLRIIPEARLQLSADAEAQSRGKAEDSQQSDTSQRILRNISNQQQALADIAHLQMQEASQARQDRALQLTLSAQAAEELNAANTRERQTAIASGNAAAAQGAMLTMPGGAVLGQPAR